ncbi:metal ABC transporter solute-binding protein, Zn/Mn family [Marispirochaeta aestuarii]|uniref:metal ABC transporter solute-binding protein, Zn/Mn family n=1 Tax=Marispirochaeta aestuarii TaxID=1963862 RepID=UPI0029C6DFFF|nr:zinc ABC transporter substrate-binding protein [Marispirochaeta aestuarii]
MNRLYFFIVLLFSAVGLVFAGGEKDVSLQDEAGIEVFVSILPQKYFVERIGGPDVEVSVMVPPGKSPATYEPTPQQIIKLGDADIFFTLGVPFEAAFLPRVSSNLKDVAIVPTDRGIRKRHLESHSHDEDEEHEHEDEHDHAHEKGAPDPHIWMDPVLVKHQGAIIRDALIDLDPDGSDAYSRRYEEFSADLDLLHEDLTEILAPAEGSILFVYHPAFGYFADRYGLRQEAIETGGKEPSPAVLEGVIAEALHEGVRIIFVQPEFPEKSAQAVADAIGGVVVPVAPLAEDYMENLRSLARKIAQGITR